MPLESALDLLEAEIIPLASLSGIANRRDIKRLLLKKFPYSVIIHERGDEILIIAFAHFAKRPGYWRSRLAV